MTYDELVVLQSLPLDIKKAKSKIRIREWYEYWNGNVYVSVSGKDSTELDALVHELYPDVPRVSVNTGLEHPHNIAYWKQRNDVIWVYPAMKHPEVLTVHGYPVVSKKVARSIHDLQNPTPDNEASRNLYLTGIKRDGTKSNNFLLAQRWRFLIDAPFKVSNKCCDAMKKQPLYDYEDETGYHSFVGEMASDGSQRKNSYLETGCNSYSTGKSKPIGFWTEQDVLCSLKSRIDSGELQISKAYGDIVEDESGYLSTTGESRTGCMFCMFGLWEEDRNDNRFTRMKAQFPKMWMHCIGGGEFNSDGKWQPNKEGLGFGFVIDYINDHLPLKLQVNYGK
jgi:3'-phosphoadenosine 5'-phosphosulfate sulfotransferase (PAPS reductase)/FAD synthetase